MAFPVLRTTDSRPLIPASNRDIALDLYIATASTRHFSRNRHFAARAIRVKAMAKSRRRQLAVRLLDPASQYLSCGVRIVVNQACKLFLQRIGCQ